MTEFPGPGGPAPAGDGEPTRYLGGLLVIDDEVVLLAFEGPMGVVRRVVDHAQLPVGRILRVAYARWPNRPTDDPTDDPTDEEK